MGVRSALRETASDTPRTLPSKEKKEKKNLSLKQGRPMLLDPSLYAYPMINTQQVQQRREEAVEVENSMKRNLNYKLRLTNYDSYPFNDIVCPTWKVIQFSL